MKNIIGIYSIFVGLSVIGMWLMILNTQVLPEGQTELSFHLFSEFLMATICIVGGILVLKKRSVGRPLTIAGLSMVIYSVLNAAGYYAEKIETPMVVMFISLFVLTAAALLMLLTGKSEL